MTNRVQLRRSTTPAAIPALIDLLVGEMAINLPDNDVFYSNGTEIVHLNAAANIKTDATHRFVTDAQIAVWAAGYSLPTASAATLGGVRIGANIDVDGSGVISIKQASATDIGVLSAADWLTFNGKQDALGYVPVNQAGDTMTGMLTLAGAPTLGNHAATKSYVDGGLSGKLDLAGGTMSGLLVLSADPTANLGAATKQYVDNAVSLVAGSVVAPVQDIATLGTTTGMMDKSIILVEDTGALYRFDAQSVATPDGTDVIAASGGGNWVKISAAVQNHEMLSGLAGGATNDHLHLTTAEKNGYDAHLADYGVHLTTAQNTLLDSINASAAEINWLVGVTSNVQTQLDGKQADLGYTPVNKAGDTMLGMLTLFADPVGAMDAATRQWTENRTIDGGQF